MTIFRIRVIYLHKRRAGKVKNGICFKSRCWGPAVFQGLPEFKAMAAFSVTSAAERVTIVGIVLWYLVMPRPHISITPLHHRTFLPITSLYLHELVWRGVIQGMERWNRLSKDTQSMTKQDLSQVLLLSLCSISFALWKALKLQPDSEKLITANLPPELHMKENMEDLLKAEMLTARK